MAPDTHTITASAIRDPRLPAAAPAPALRPKGDLLIKTLAGLGGVGGGFIVGNPQGELLAIAQEPDGLVAVVGAWARGTAAG